MSSRGEAAARPLNLSLLSEKLEVAQTHGSRTVLTIARFGNQRAPAWLYVITFAWEAEGLPV